MTKKMDDQNNNSTSDQTNDASAAENVIAREEVQRTSESSERSNLDENKNQDSDAPQNDNSDNPFAALKEESNEESAEMKPEDPETENTEPKASEGTEIASSPEESAPRNDEGESETEEPTTEEPESENGEPKTENDQEPEKPTVPVNPKARWYVVHTFAGHENKVATALRQRIEAEHLENLIFDILVPTQDKIEIKGGKKETVKEKIFPGYILIKMELTDLSWLAVRTTQGVTSFIGAGNKPTPISEAEVASIVKFTTQGAQPTFKDVFMVDDTVKIVDGPFAEFIGKVDSVDKEKGRVRVLVSIFGRETPVELDFLQVQKL